MGKWDIFEVASSNVNLIVLSHLIEGERKSPNMAIVVNDYANADEVEFHVWERLLSSAPSNHLGQLQRNVASSR